MEVAEHQQPHVEPIPSQECAEVVPEIQPKKSSPKPILIRKKPPGKHFVSSPTSEKKSADSDSDDDTDSDEESQVPTRNKSAWPKIPTFINSKKDLTKGDEVKVMAYMLGMDTSSLVMSRLEHLIQTFVSNEKKIQKAYDKWMSFEGKEVQKLMETRTRLIGTMVRLLSGDVQAVVEKRSQK